MTLSPRRVAGTRIGPVYRPPTVRRAHALALAARNVVRLRHTPGRPVYPAVFPSLTAGGYDVWRDGVTRAGTVLVRGGHVTSFLLD